MKALIAGTVDAACIIDGNRLAFNALEVVAGERDERDHHTAAYDHCNMTVLDDAPASTQQFGELLLGMSYDDPEVRPLLDMEGLKVWLPGRTSGYGVLARAVDRFGTLDAWLASR